MLPTERRELGRENRDRKRPFANFVQLEHRVREKRKEGKEGTTSKPRKLCRKDRNIKTWRVSQNTEAEYWYQD